MKTTILNYASYLVLIFGFLYMAFHLGRSYEAKHYATVHIAECKTDGFKLACDHVAVEIKKNRESYERLIRELQNPKPKRYWNNKYQEFKKNGKVGL